MPPRTGRSPTPSTPHGDSPRSGCLLRAGPSAQDRRSPVHRLYWTGSSGPPGPAPNDTGSRLTAAFRSRSCSVPQRSHLQRRTLRSRPCGNACRSPQALHDLDDGNSPSATVVCTPASPGLVLELPPELVQAELGDGTPLQLLLRDAGHSSIPMLAKRRTISVVSLWRVSRRRFTRRAWCLRRRWMAFRRLWLPRIFRDTSFDNRRRRRSSRSHDSQVDRGTPLCKPRNSRVPAWTTLREPDARRCARGLAPEIRGPEGSRGPLRGARGRRARDQSENDDRHGF